MLNEDDVATTSIDRSKSTCSGKVDNEGCVRNQNLIHRFSCGFCGRSFQEENEFFSHLREHHAERKRKKQKLTATVKPSVHNLVTDQDMPTKVVEQKPKVETRDHLVEEASKISPSVDAGPSLVKREISGQDFKPTIQIKTEPADVDPPRFSELSPTSRPIKQETPNKPPSPLFQFSGPLTSDFEPAYFDCTECCFRGKTSESLVDHMTALHSQRILHLIREKEKAYFDCKECCFRAPTNEALQNHIRVLHVQKSADSQEGSSGEKNFLDCTFCCFRAQTADALIKHNRVLHQHTLVDQGSNHTSRETSQVFDCSKCSFRAQNTTALSKHMASLHPKRRKTVNCDRCSFSASSSLQLASHKREVHLKSLRCGTCGFVAACQLTLDGHVYTEHS